MTEEELGQEVEKLLELFGWLWCHFRPARTRDGWRTAITGHKGFPDYFAVKSTRTVAIELKSEKGKVTNEQQIWLTALAATKTEVYLWRPRDLKSGAIERVLR